MPRPTPARMMYLVVGLILGLASTIAGQIYVLPGILASIPFVSASPTPVTSSGPLRFTAAILQRVALINSVQERSGVTLRLNTLEVYRDGVAVSYAIASSVGASPATLEADGVSLGDDRGTVYSLSPVGSSSSLSAGLTTGAFAFTPVPPAEAKTLRLLVPNVIALGQRLREGQSRVTTGNWEFQIPLGG